MTPPEPEILDEAAIADDEYAVERRGPVDLMQVPRLLAGALNDLRSIAEGMAVLPQLLVTLRGIQDEVRELNTEVTAMRADVGELKQGMDRLEPHIEDVTRVAHPLRRLNPARRRASGGS
jgi:hypothetical protein